MGRRVLTLKHTFQVLFGLSIVYLLLWPVPVDPLAWKAPTSEGYVGAFQKNNGLKDLSFIDLNGETGPEDAALSKDGTLYVSAHSGKILKVNLETKSVSVFADPKGRVLGVEVANDGTLYGADAYRGLIKISQGGQVILLTDRSQNGQPLLYTNDLDIASSGQIYFSDSSTKFSPKEIGGTLPASLLDIVEHRGLGRVLMFNPAKGETTEIIKGLNFANGVALSKDESYLLISETGSYRILKHWLKGDKKGQTEVLLSNLPGFPDNINDNPDGTFWVGLVSPRSKPLDLLSSSPFLRKVMMRLPEFIRPKPQRYGFAVRFTGEGKIIETLQDPQGAYAMVTGGLDVGDKSVITSLTEGRIGIFQKK